MNNLNRWIRSKQGLTIIGLVVVIALIIAVIGTQTGIFGTAGGPGPGIGPQFAAPQGGYSCLPTCLENDGKFLVMVGGGLSSFGGNKSILWIAVPSEASSFELGIFDGDTGKDNTGANNWTLGNWDRKGYEETTYTLFADPLMDGKGTTVVGSWQGNAGGMPNNAWWTQNISNVEAARAQSGVYYYKLQIEKADGPSANGFKIRTSGYLTAGKGDVVGTSLGITGAAFTMPDFQVLYPEFIDGRDPGSITTYTGDWNLFFYVPENTTRLEIWDGDFDRGISITEDLDTDDPNTDGVPGWSVPGVTVSERAGGAGIPPDDNLGGYIGFRPPSVMYEIYDPDGNLIAVNDDPSGTEEWERFVISSDASVADADKIVSSLKSGTYTLKIKGLDLFNFVWVYVDQYVSGGPPDCIDCPPPPPPCIDENLNLGGGHAIIALNPAGCQGQQNGLLFHGTSDTFLTGTAWSNGCLRAVGTTNVQMTDGPVYYVGETFGNMDLIKDAATQQGSDIEKAPAVLDPATYTVAAPDCSDPRAHQVNAKKDWKKGDIHLEPGLYCVTGDVTINAKQSFTGDGVTIYMMDGKLTINGGSTVKLTAPLLVGDEWQPALPNILFYVNGSGGRPEVHIEGGNDTVFQGVLYAPGSEVELLGNSFVEGIYRSQIIGWDVRVGGTADLYLGYESLDIPICVYPEP